MKLYLKYLSIQLKSQMQFKASLGMTILGQFLVSFTMLLSVYILFDRFNSVLGFEFEEVLICFAVVLMAFSLSECFARGFDTFQTVIGNGEFDRIMVRPRNEILQVLAARIDFSRLGRLFQAVLIFCYAIPASGIHWTWDKVITLVFMVLGGIVVFSGLFLVYAAFCFFTLEGLEFMNIFTDGGREFGAYPFAIYGDGVLKFLTYVVPLALFQYYPLLYLIGRTHNLLYMFTPIISMLFIVPCYAFWRFGVRHYKSTGS